MGRDRAGVTPSGAVEARDQRMAQWHAFAVARTLPARLPDWAWAEARIPAGWQVELACPARHDWQALAGRMLLPGGETATAYLLTDDGEAHFRAVAFEDDLMTGALLAGPAPLREGRDWLAARLGTALGPTERFRLLAGRPGGFMRARGATLCFCCDVGLNEIADAVAAGARTLDAVGAATRAGTNCGRCRDDVARIIAGPRVAP